MQFPKREGKRQGKWQIVREIAFVSAFPPLFSFAPSVHHRTFPFGILGWRSVHEPELIFFL
jgi:hypothetical protein